MAKQKFYAVRVGRVPGIYQTWGQAEEQIKGFSGAEFKAFDSEEDALKYISYTKDENLDVPDDTDDINNKVKLEIQGLQDGEVIAFVDGSYSEDIDGREKYSFGVVLITNESEDILYKAFVNDAYMGSRNIAGEIEGVKQAILWAIQSNKNSIKIYYDYEGIEKWAKKEWKAQKDISKEYSKFFDEKSNFIRIDFQHVKAHSGILYNEKADGLAKKALLSQGYKTYEDGSVYFIGFGKQDWICIVNKLNEDIESKDIDEKISISESRPKEYCDRLEFAFKKEKVVINCYRGDKSYVQGKPSTLLQNVISSAIENLKTDDAVIEILKSYHALTVEKEEVENAFSLILPDFPTKNKDIKLRNTLLSAVFNTLVVGYMPDYTCLVTPLFRAMEFYLHRILSDKLGKNTTKSDGGNNFSYFSKDKETKSYRYNSSTRNLNDTQIDYLNVLYNRYKNIRHPYSHWSEDSADTQVITDIKTAHDWLNEGLQIINKYYILF